jgi:hypothetical protein
MQHSVTSVLVRGSCLWLSSCFTTIHDLHVIYLNDVMYLSYFDDECQLQDISRAFSWDAHRKQLKSVRRVTWKHWYSSAHWQRLRKSDSYIYFSMLGRLKSLLSHSSTFEPSLYRSTMSSSKLLVFKLKVVRSIPVGSSIWLRDVCLWMLLGYRAYLSETLPTIPKQGNFEDICWIYGWQGIGPQPDI